MQDSILVWTPEMTRLSSSVNVVHHSSRLYGWHDNLLNTLLSELNAPQVSPLVRHRW